MVWLKRGPENTYNKYGSATYLLEKLRTETWFYTFDRTLLGSAGIRSSLQFLAICRAVWSAHLFGLRSRAPFRFPPSLLSILLI